MGDRMSSRVVDEKEKLEVEESKLAEKLREACDARGREKDLEQASAILHKMGLVYLKRSPDMFSLIRSATLLNAALTRTENVKEIEKDRARLCAFVLQVAGAENKNADLIQQSIYVKQQISEMRREVNGELQKLHQMKDKLNKKEQQDFENTKIHNVQKLQEYIAQKYTNIMADLSQYCDKVMGPPPCKYAVVGMGSLARKEITPYSDFEHIILLEKFKSETETVLEYFRWFSVIFQIVIVNLQETIVPSVAISSLNNWFYDCITTRGISFDGMMLHACKFPLGRQNLTLKKPWKTELIKPVAEMLKYLSSEENLKNGYHLSDILTKTSFVHGDKKIFDEFENGIVDLRKNEVSVKALEEVKSQLTDDLKHFAARSMLLQISSKNKFDVKKNVYRSTTLFVAALGRIYKVSGSSCFDILENLAEKGEISEFAKHKLMYAVALACEIRLKWYMKNKRQTDLIASDNAVAVFLSIVGKSSSISYFQIAYALQCDISKRFQLKKMHFYSNPTLFNINIYRCFNDELMDSLIRRIKIGNTAKRFLDFEECLHLLQKDSMEEKETTQLVQHIASSKLLFENACAFRKLGEHLQELHCFDDAKECYVKAIEIWNNIFRTDDCLLSPENKQHNANDSNNTKCFLNSLLAQKSGSKFDNHNLQQVQEKKNSFRKIFSLKEAQEKLNKVLPSKEKRFDFGEDFDSVEEIENDFVKNLAQQKIFKLTGNVPANVCENVEAIAILAKDAGYCLLELRKLNEAIAYMKMSLLMQAQLSTNVTVDNNVAFILYNIGCCLMEMRKFEMSIDYLECSLGIAEKVSRDNESDVIIAVTLHEIGHCLSEMRKLKEAKDYLIRALAIKKRISSDSDADDSVAKTLHELGHCLVEMSQYSDAKHYLLQALEVKRRISLDLFFDQSYAMTLHETGHCLNIMGSFSEAENYFLDSLRIKEEVSLDPDSDIGIAHTYHELGSIAMHSKELKKAKNYFEKSLEIKKQASQNVNHDENLALTAASLQLCVEAMNNVDLQ